MVPLSVQLTITFFVFWPGPDDVAAPIGTESVGTGLESCADHPGLVMVAEALQVGVSVAATARLVTKIGKLLGLSRVRVRVLLVSGPTPDTDP
jgi:hypothetical protein